MGWGVVVFLLLLLLLLPFLGFLRQRSAVWLSGVSPCKCVLSRVISVLPFGNGRSGFSSPYEMIIAMPGAGDQLLRETDASLFPPVSLATAGTLSL